MGSGRGARRSRPGAPAAGGEARTGGRREAAGSGELPRAAARRCRPACPAPLRSQRGAGTPGTAAPPRPRVALRGGRAGPGGAARVSPAGGHGSGRPRPRCVLRPAGEGLTLQPRHRAAISAGGRSVGPRRASSAGFRGRGARTPPRAPTAGRAALPSCVNGHRTPLCRAGGGFNSEKWMPGSRDKWEMLSAVVFFFFFPLSSTSFPSPSPCLLIWSFCLRTGRACPPRHRRVGRGTKSSAGLA